MTISMVTTTQGFTSVTQIGGSAMQLTPREAMVLRMLAEAASNREIAESLTISPRTVEAHLGNIYGKLMVRGRSEAMLWAIRSGLGSN